MLFFAIARVQAAEPNQFRFHKDIELAGGDGSKEVLSAVPLDADVCASTRDGFPDVRVFDSTGRETPFLLEKATETKTRTVRGPCSTRTLSLKEQGDGLEIIVELEKGSSSAQGLAIHTPLRNFERRVQVFGAAGGDGNDWNPLAADGLIFDYSRYMDVSNREIRLPKNDFRRFKIIVSGIADVKESPFMQLTRKVRRGDETERVEQTVLERRPFRIDRIDFWGERTETLPESEKTVEYPVALLGVMLDLKEKTTVLDVQARRAPLTELSLATPSRNFSRAVEVRRMVAPPPLPGEQAPGEPVWTAFASGRVASIEFGGYSHRALAVEFAQQREPRFQIVIRNEDNPPLEIVGVQGRGPQWQAVFLAAVGEKYRLAYGAERLESPRYDAAAVLAPLRIRGARPVECRLGPEVAGPVVAVVEPQQAWVKKLLNNPIFLGGCVVLLVVFLGWTMFRAMRRINELPKE